MNGFVHFARQRICANLSFRVAFGTRGMSRLQKAIDGLGRQPSRRVQFSVNAMTRLDVALFL